MIYIPAAYGPAARQVRGVYAPTDPHDVNFTGNFTIGLGRDRSCSAEPDFSGIMVIENPPSPEFVTFTNRFALRLTCQTFGAFLDIALIDGSSLTLTVDDRHGLGFEAGQAVRILGDGVDPGEIIHRDPVEIQGRTLFKTVEIIWNSGLRTLDEFPLEVEADLSAWSDGEPVDVVAGWSLTLADTAGELDSAPFDGPDQRLGCRAGFVVGQGLWKVGALGDRFGSGRVIPHLTRRDGGFKTRLNLANLGAQAQSIVITGYDQQGLELRTHAVRVEAGQVQTTEAEDFFGEDEAAYAVVSGEAMDVAIVYEADRPNASPAHVSTAIGPAPVWRIYPGNPSVTWDGIAVVNVGPENATIRALQKDLAGGVIDSGPIIDQLGPGAKTLYVFSSQFEHRSDSYFEIMSDQPVYLTALRGDLASAFLWENLAIPIFD